MKPSTAIAWLWRRFRYGPQGDTPGRVLGVLLWWRMWATITMIVAPHLAGVLVFTLVDPYHGLVVTWVASVFCIPKAMSLSPKYDMEENY